MSLRIKLRAGRQRQKGGISRLLGAEVFCSLLLVAASCGSALGSEPTEGYFEVPMPPHFSVQATEIDGPVFADAHGRTLYRWPFGIMRAGVTGDAKGETRCTDVKTTENSGYMSPYPGGFLLPDVDTRPSCAQAWPPALAAADAKPVGKWTLLKRKDGSKQWAYDGSALYTSLLDQKPGEVIGVNVTPAGYRSLANQPALRELIQPTSDAPPGFTVATVRAIGRLLVDDRGFSVYWSDRDGPNRSRCDWQCARIWSPMLAPASAQPHGAWSIFERSPGVRQWAYRKRPLYQYTLDSYEHSFQGSDEPGWRNVLIQAAPAPPAQFTVQNTTSGQVLADVRGKTIYTYFCVDDAVDQLGCDHPNETQAYRLAMCGGGDADRCVHTFPYVPAEKAATSRNRSWSVLNIDPKTGRLGKPGAPGVLRVWAYRGRPVYTFSGDTRPGDVNADGFGEFQGQRQGFHAFWVRDDFLQLAG